MGIRDYLVKHVIMPEIGALENRSETPTPPDTSGILPPPRVPSNTYVDQKTALSLVPVFRSVQTISAVVSNLSLTTERYGKPTNSNPSWITRPDIKMSRSEFLQQTVNSLALQGQAFWHVVRDTPTDAPTALIVLNPLECHPLEDGTLGWARRNKPLQPWEFQHLRFLSVPGELRGLGPIQMAQSTLRGAITAREWGTQQLRDTYLPPGILKTEQELMPEEAAAYKARWDAQAANGGTAVLGRGLDYKRTLLTFEEVEWVAGLNLSVQDINRLFGIPQRIGMYSLDGSSLTYANLTEEMRVFLTTTLSSYYRPIEESLSNLLPRGSAARFDLNTLLRPDHKTRSEIYASGLAGKWLTVSEIRDMEGLPELPEPAPEQTEEVPNE